MEVERWSVAIPSHNHQWEEKEKVNTLEGAWLPFTGRKKQCLKPSRGSIWLVANLLHSISSMIWQLFLSETQQSLLPLQSLLNHLVTTPRLQEDRPTVYFHVCCNLSLKYVNMKIEKLDVPFSTF